MSNSTISQSCAVAPDSTPSDAGIAGAGILIAFISTATLALVLSTYITLSEVFVTQKTRPIHLTKQISRKLLLGLSDQQLITGISIQSLALARINSMVPYHFFICWMLSLLSTATNFAALLALVQDFKRDWVLRWLRQAAMFVNMGLTIVLGVLVLEVHLKNLPQTLVIGCVWEEGFRNLPDDEKGNGSTSSSALSTAGTIAVIAASVIIFALGTWYLHLRKQTWGRFVRIVSLSILWATAIGATFRVVSVSQAFGSPSVKLSDDGERIWSFGQLLAMVMLVLPFISALEIYRGELQIRPNTADGEIQSVDDQIPLRYSYQRNPFIK